MRRFLRCARKPPRFLQLLDDMMMQRIPVTVVTGFLGSGKTTLLNRLLKDPALRDAAVIVNEFGEVGLDHLLIAKADEGIIELSDGCLCCTIRGDLMDTLASLIDRLQTGRIAKLSRVVIETTGLADPAPILQAVLAHPAMLQAYEIDGVITTVDAVNGEATLAAHQEAVKQAAFADRIVLTKQDLLKTAPVNLIARLKALNPNAEIIDAGDIISPAALIDCGIFDIGNKTADIKRWLKLEDEHAHHHHDHHHDVNRHSAHIRAFALTTEQPVPYAALDAFIDLLRATKGEKLLRMKGIVKLQEDPSRPVVIHGVQTLFHPPQRLQKWPEDKHQTRLVIIGDGLEEDEIRRLFDAFLSKPAIDMADRMALMDNPLAIPGMKF